MLENVKVKPEMEHYVAWQQWPDGTMERLCSGDTWEEAYQEGKKTFKEKYGK